MQIFTRREWEAIRKDPLQRENVKNASRRPLVILSHLTHQGPKDFKLEDEEVLPVDEDLELLPSHELEEVMRSRRLRHEEIRKVLLSPSKKTIDQILAMVHLDMKTPRSVVGESISQEGVLGS